MDSISLSPRSLSIDRRRMLGHAGLLAAGVGLVAAGVPEAAFAAGAKSANGDVGIMQGALAIEHEGIAAYRLAGKSGLLTPPTLKVALIFMGHHQAHRDALAKLITSAGGKPVEPKPDADYVKELNLGALKTEGDVIVLATNLEQGAANAYVGQIAGLQDKSLVHLFAQLSTDETVHWTTLNNAQNKPIPANAFLFG